MSSRLPRKLGKEPLIDVMFEVRFETDAPAGGLLPGLVLPLVKGTPTFEALPASQLPAALRDQDPALRHVGLMRMDWDENFVVIFGDRLLGVGCKMPYSGWERFKQTILTVVGVLASASFIKKIERHSLKYVDFFKTNEYQINGMDFFSMTLQLGPRNIREGATNLRTEIADGEFLQAITIFTSAKVKKADGQEQEGSILDVDSHRIQEFADVKDFVSQLPALLDEIHSANKEFFFSCLSENGLKELEPQYE